jgi:sec-independent protein translocase protein TatC
MAGESEEPQQSQFSDMPLLEHLEELRQRLIRIFAFVIVFTIATYVFSEYIVDFMVEPVGTVYFREPTAAFLVRLKAALFGGVMLSVPVVLYHLWRFVAPGLYQHEAKSVLPIMLFGTLFFFGGASFCFFVVVPAALQFLQGFATDTVRPWIDIKEYFSFILWMCLAFGVVFELPVVSFFLGKAGVISSRWLAKGRRYAIAIMLVAGALLTPPDIFSQVALAIPLYFLYEVSIIVVRLTGRREKKT